MPPKQYFVRDSGRLYLNPEAICPKIKKTHSDLKNDTEEAAAIRCMVDSPMVRNHISKLSQHGPCLCCLSTCSRDTAVQVAKQLGFVVPRWRSDPTSAAFVKMTMALMDSDPGPHLNVQKCGVPDGAHNAFKRLGANVAYCERERRMWCARTKKDKKTLRMLADALKRRGLSLRIRKPTVYEMVSAIVPYSMQIVEVWKNGTQVTDYKIVWEEAERLLAK